MPSVLAVLLVTGVLAVPASALVRTERISVTTRGAQANGSMSMFGRQDSISRHGRFISFESDATNLSGEDVQLRTHGYVRDRDADRDGIFDEPRGMKTIRMDVATNGDPGLGTTFGAPALSEGGRFAAFASNAFNLDPDYFNLTANIFVRDRDTDRDRKFDEPGSVRTVQVSVSSAGVAGDYYSLEPVISGGGRFVAFASLATNLVDDDTNGGVDVFVRDRDTDRDGIFDEPDAVMTSRMSLAGDGTEGNGDSGSPGAITGNGRFVVFDSIASNLVPGDTNGSWDVFVRDRDTDTDGILDEPGAVETIRVSASSTGDEGDAGSFGGVLAGWGRFLAFQSSASNLVEGDTNGRDDVFVRDRDTDRDGIFDEPDAVSTVRVNLSTTGDQATWGGSLPSLSANGRFVSFGSIDANLVVPADPNGWSDAFVRDRDTDRDGIFDEPDAVATYRVGLTKTGSPPSGSTTAVQLSADGRWAVFETDAHDVVLPDLQWWNTEVYVRGPLPR